MEPNRVHSMKHLCEIFWSFLKIGPVTFGGGYAMIPLIEREVVERRKWVNVQDIADVFAVAESIPGAIAVNSATFIGYRLAGVRGAVAALLGVLLPTFVIVITLCMFFLQVKDHPKIEAAFEGIRACIVALITYAAFKIGKTAILDKMTLTIVGVTVFILYFLHIHPILIIVSGAFVGILMVKIRECLGWATKLEAKEAHAYLYQDYFVGDGI